MYIAIEGPIGVGKTTLAKFLAKRLKAETLLEVVEENPFLPHFYQDPERYGFSVQAFFLLSRYKQLLPMSQPRLFTGNVVTDYIFDKDYIFASMNLSAAEWDLYADLYKHLAPRLSAPDLTLYLQAPVHILLKRITKRGRPFEHPTWSGSRVPITGILQPTPTPYGRWVPKQSTTSTMPSTATGSWMKSSPERDSPFRPEVPACI